MDTRTAGEIEMYSEITKHIRVTVVPAPLLDNSDPRESVFAFSYSIKIENLGEHTVQLLERHWLVHSGGTQLAEVVGPGVVGEQPVLEAGQVFEYTSGAVIQDPIGAMEGTYTFRGHDGKFFEVQIPKFELMYPVVVH
jgi:ApaG protein